MKYLRFFRRDTRGVGAVEFALICPVFFGMLIGITQLGALYFARADLRNGVAAGARQAQIFPRPTTAAITSTITGKFVRLKSNKLTGPTITYDKDSRGYEYAEIQVSYAVPVDFIIYRTRPITLTERRRVFLSPTS